MRRIGLLFGTILLVVLLLGLSYLAFFDIPVPTSNVEKVLPDGRFPK